MGVLAFQGGVAEHLRTLENLGCEAVEVRDPSTLDSLSALILPGGESTTLISLMNRWGLTRRIRELALDGFPVMGTCAGAVLLSGEIREREHDVIQESLGVARVRAIRNHYGRQVSSFVQDVEVEGLDRPFRGIFIRAPLLQPLSDDVRVLGKLGDEPVLLRQDNLWLLSFHPELTGDPAIHSMFLREHGLLHGKEKAC